MKNFVLPILFLFIFLSCSKEEIVNKENLEETIEFCIDFTFVENGDMTKAGNHIYNEFYNAYIKSKRLVLNDYSLYFLNLETNDYCYVWGQWSEKKMIKLPVGEYHVEGYSERKIFRHAIDSLSVSFNENIIIDHNTKNIHLTASNNCALLLIPPTQIYNQVDLGIMDAFWYNIYNVLYPITELGGIRYAFVNSDYSYFTLNYKFSIHPFYTYVHRFPVSPFENGKYYYCDFEDKYD